MCTPLGNTCPKEFPMSPDWHDEEEEEDKVKGEDKDKDNEKKTPQTNPRFFAVMTLTLQLSKPSITEYFCKMSCVTTIIDALEEEHRHDTTITPQEHDDQNQEKI